MKLLLFILFPLLELYGLVVLGSYITGLGVIAWVIGTALLGSWIIKVEGQQGLFTFQDQLRSGKMPEELLFNKLAVFLAGVLFLIPGVISDVMAILLLVPFTRHLCIRLLVSWMKKQMSQGTGRFSSNGTFFYYSHREPPQEPPTVTYDCTLNEPDDPSTIPHETPLVIDCEVVDEKEDTDKPGK